MKTLIEIGGAVVLLIVLLSKKKENKPLSPVIDILPPKLPETPLEVVNQLNREITNASISPTLTTYQVSENQALLNALTGEYSRDAILSQAENFPVKTSTAVL